VTPSPAQVGEVGGGGGGAACEGEGGAGLGRRRRPPVPPKPKSSVMDGSAAMASGGDSAAGDSRGDDTVSLLVRANSGHWRRLRFAWAPASVAGTEGYAPSRHPGRHRPVVDDRREWALSARTSVGQLQLLVAERIGVPPEVQSIYLRPPPPREPPECVGGTGPGRRQQQQMEPPPSLLEPPGATLGALGVGAGAELWLQRRA
jgi:hypothetical protein